ncbi:uncharacterized protein LOC100210827 isoform X1 [Hydra vulgaris]|uniref:uncharacterized protein LOC100210827 isoform X1 n=1 Tax=Hydra vulgaris TaxID=6087 RepID=UPI001F5F7E5E|nr:uncharacterized protein LOC100210827 [Hydra vulgaris]
METYQEESYDEKKRLRMEKRERRKKRDEALTPEELIEKEKRRQEKKEKKKAERKKVKEDNDRNKDDIDVEKAAFLVRSDSDLKEVVVVQLPTKTDYPISQVTIDIPENDKSIVDLKEDFYNRDLPTENQVVKNNNEDIEERLAKKKELKEKLKRKTENPDFHSPTPEILDIREKLPEDLIANESPRSLEERLAKKKALKDRIMKKTDNLKIDIEEESAKTNVEIPTQHGNSQPEVKDSNFDIITIPPLNIKDIDTPETVNESDKSPKVNTDIQTRIAMKKALKERVTHQHIIENDQIDSKEKIPKKRVTINEEENQTELFHNEETALESPKSSGAQDLTTRLAIMREKKKQKENRSSPLNFNAQPYESKRENDFSKQIIFDDDQLEKQPLQEDEQDINDDIISERKISLAPLSDEKDLPWAMYKDIINNNEEGDDELDIPEEPESDDEKYNPTINNGITDLYDVLVSMDAKESQLNIKTQPLFQSDLQKQNLKDITELKKSLAEEEIKVYLDEFEQRVEQEILMIGNISFKEIQEEETRLREEHITFQQLQVRVQRQRQEEISKAMERAKKYVMSKYKEKQKEIRMREEHLMQKDRSYKDEIHRAFRRSESQLRKALKVRKAEVKTMYGDLTFADGQYGGSKGRRWKIDWDQAPQPIQVRIKCLRGVKDKLPCSRYVLMISLYNRLGGNVMKWSNLKGQQWGGATLPIFHGGEFFNTEMKVDQSVFTVCPSRPDIRPGMVLVFELFILRGPVTPIDKVVGWGCFPVCDAEFNVIEGKYKAPFLRGSMDPGIDKFEVIEKLMADDLENWLCNFYFEIIKLPRYMAGQKEYEVELQFTSGLLSAPVRTIQEEENIDGERPIYGSKTDVNFRELSHLSIRATSVASSGNNSTEKPNYLSVDDEKASSSGSSGNKGSSSHFDSQTNQIKRAEVISADLKKRKQSKDLQVTQTITSVTASRQLIEEKGLQFSGDSDSDYESDFNNVKKDEEFKPVKGQPGMFYKIHHNTPAEVYAQRMYTMMPKTPVIAEHFQTKKKKLTHLEELSTYSFSVKLPFSTKGHIEHRSAKKTQYLSRMLLTELGISQIKSREFWSMIFMLLVCYWIRLYCHYIGQWIALLGFLVPLNRFEFLPHTVNLNYQNTLLRTREEIALIVIGPFTNIILFCIMIIISAFIQLLFDRFPNIFSKFIMAFGIHCVMDPVWILITDSALGRFRNLGGDNPIGDGFKLYWHFNQFYNNDNVTLFISIALTSFLYFVTMFCACSLLYMYFLRLHNNGRLMDVYWRLQYKEEAFFIPHDLEISNEELNYVCRKAEQWRGEEGERRKTAVYDYVWEEEEINDWNESGEKTGTKEITTHISIHTLYLDGLRELYRHFLKLPDGAIIEVFGEMNIPGLDDGLKQALMKKTTFQSLQLPKKRNISRSNSRSSIAKDGTSRQNRSNFLGV